MTDHEALAALAEAATPGPWRFMEDPSNTVVSDGGGDTGGKPGHDVQCVA